MKSYVMLSILPLVKSFAVIESRHLCNQYCNTLFSTSPSKRVPRRDLEKRSRKSRDGNSRTTSSQPPEGDMDNATTQFMEIRPLVRSKLIEAGEDYWIDEAELQKSIAREKAIRNRKAMEGEITKEKLVSEVVAPYKQNWIGIISVFVIAISFIVSQFPELLDTPIISIPDL